MANTTTYAIKGDVKDLETKLKNTSQLASELFESIEDGNKKLIPLEKKLLDLTTKHKQSSKELKQEISSLNFKKIENGRLTKEEAGQLRKLNAQLKENNRLYRQKKSEINEDIALTKKIISLQNSERKNHLKNVSAIQSEIKHRNASTSAKNKATDASVRHGSSLRKEDAERRALGTTLVRHIRRLETMAVAYYAVSRAYRSTIGAGIDLNRQYENLEMGMSAIIASKIKAIDITGKEADAYEKFAYAQSFSLETLDKIKKASTETPASFQQMAGFYQQAIGTALATGDAFGDSLQEISDNTITLTKRMSNLASAVGMPMERVDEEIRSLMSANASTDSILAKILFGSPAKANEAVREASKRTGGLKKLMEDMLAPFSVLEGQSTFDKELARLQARIQDIQRTSTKPIFDDIRLSFIKLNNYLAENGDEIVDEIQTTYEVFTELSVSVLDSLDAFSELSTSSGLNDLNDTLPSLNESVAGVSFSFGVFFDILYNGIKTLEIAYLRVKTIKDELKLGIAEPLTGALDNITDYVGFYGKLYGVMDETDIQAIKDRRRKTLDDINNDATDGLKENLKKLELELSKIKTPEQIAQERADQLLKTQETLTFKQQNRKAYGGFSLGTNLKGVKADSKEYLSIVNSTYNGLAEMYTKDMKAYEGNTRIKLFLEEKYTKQIAKLNKELQGSRSTVSIGGVAVDEKALKRQKDLMTKWLAEKEGLAGAGGTQYDQQRASIAKRELQLLEKYKSIQESKVVITQWASTKISDINKKEQEELGNIYDKFSDKIKNLATTSRDWTAGLEGNAKAIANISNAYSDMMRETDKYDALTRDISKSKLKQDKKDELLAKAEKERKKSEIQGYANLAGAISNSFEEGSKNAEAFKAVQSSLSLYNAVTAVTGAWASAPFPANLPAVATTSASVVALLSQLGSSVQGLTGGNTTSVSYDSFSAMKETTGMGTSFGASDKASQSIVNSLDILQEFAEPQYRAIVDMRDSMLDLNTNISSFVNQAIMQGALNSDFVVTSRNYKSYGSTSIQGLTDTYSGLVNLVTDNVGEVLSNVLGDTLGGALSGTLNFIFGGWASKVFGGAFGGSVSSSSALNDYGVTFNNQLITEAIKAIEGSAYQTIKTTVHESGGWFSGDRTTEYFNTYFSQIDATLAENMSMTLGSVYASVLSASEAIGLDTTSVMQDLSDFMIGTTKISFNKSGDKIEEDFKSLIGSIADSLSVDALNGLLDQYRQVGEGMFETLTRVATEVTVVTKTLSLVNQDISSDTIGITESLVGMSESLSNFQDITSNYYDKYFSDEEKLQNNVTILSGIFDKLNLTLPTTYEGFRAIVESLDLNTDSGRNAYITLMQVSDLFDVVAKSTSENLKLIESDVESKMNRYISFFDTVNNFISKLRADISAPDVTSSFATFTDNFNKLTEGVTTGASNLSSLTGSAIASANTYLADVTKTATSAGDLAFEKAIMANRFENLTLTAEASINDLIDTTVTYLGDTSPIVTWLKEIANNTTFLSYSDWQKQQEVNTAYNLVPAQGFATGGYTGDVGTSMIAGVVHGQEYVVNAQTTKNLGLNQDNGGVFNDISQKLGIIQNLLIKSTADGSRSLTTQRAILGELGA